MLETLFGGLLGGIFRCIPEFLGFFDKKNERKHELDMQDKQIEFTKIQGAQKMDEIGAQRVADFDKGALQALVESIKTQNIQFTPTGYKLVDFFMAAAVFMSATIRPVVTYIVVSLYCAMKICLVAATIQQSTATNWIDLAKIIWTADDMGILAAILNFWFLGRVFEKIKGAT